MSGKRIVEISKFDDTLLKVEYNQLKIMINGTLVSSIPIEDIAILIIDNKNTLYSHALIILFGENNIPIVLCDDKHMPVQFILPLFSNCKHSQRLNFQIEKTKSIKGSCWKSIVKSKIKSQINTLKMYKKEKSLNAMQRCFLHVKSGDKNNVEAYVASVYWKDLFGSDFLRRRSGDHPNGILNYGYAIIRACVARSLLAYGLNPSIGIFHSNQFDPYPLSNDIIEPFRCIVDRKVYDIIDSKKYTEQDFIDMTSPIKQDVLTILTDYYVFKGEKWLVQSLINKYIESLLTVYKTGDPKCLMTMYL